MSDFLSRLNYVIDKEANGRHTVFAKKAGIPPSTFQAYLKGRLPHAEHLIRIYETFAISIDWLLTGNGNTYAVKAPENDYTVFDKSPELKVVVQTPLLQEILQCVEKMITQNKNWRLSPDKKAEAVTVLYELFAGSRKEVAPQTIQRYLKLIAQ